MSTVITRNQKLQSDYKMYFFFLQNTTGLHENKTLPPDVRNNPGRRKRTAELSLITSPPTFTATISDRTLPTGATASSLTHSGQRSANPITNTDAQSTAHSVVTEKSSTSYVSALYSTSIQSSDSAVSGTSALSLTSVPPATLPPWLTRQSHAGDMTSDSSPLALTPGQLRLSTHDASVTGHFLTRSAAATGTTGGRALIINTASLNFLQPLIQGFVSVLINPVCARVVLCIHLCLHAYRRCNSERGGDGRFV